MGVVYAPIWRDTYFTYATTNIYVDYTITLDGVEIYSGRAYRMPSEASIRIRLNDIARDYLSQDFPIMVVADNGNTDPVQNTKAFRKFLLKIGNAEEYEYYFWWSWSYLDEDEINYNGRYLGQPVNGHRAEWSAALATYQEPGYEETGHSDIEYPIVVPCGEYVLHYTNRFGGWNSFLFEGLCRRVDALTEYTSSNRADAASIGFAKQRYAVKIQRKWQCTTGFLTDAEAERFALDVIPTTLAYLSIGDGGNSCPVLVTDTSAEVKTYEGNGRRLIQYTITLAASQIQDRR